MEAQASLLCSLQDPILSQVNPVHTLIPSSLEIRLNIGLTFLLQLDLSSSTFTSDLRLKRFMHFFITPIRATCLSHDTPLDLNYEIPRCVIFSLFSLTSSLCGPNILLPALFSKPSICALLVGQIRHIYCYVKGLIAILITNNISGWP
jgi:hypothetical protein